MARKPRTPLDVTVSVVTTGFRLATWTERQTMALVLSRLFPDGLPTAPPSPPPAALAAPQPIELRMRRLLDRALEQSPADGRMALFEKLVDELVPDEARILGALSDGSASPLINIRARSRGSAGELVLENASLIGRTANLTLASGTSTYVAHLLTLGLLQVGPEDPALKDEYEILLADTAILKAMKAATRGPVAPRVERLTLVMSPLGHELWAACVPDGGQPS